MRSPTVIQKRCRTSPKSYLILLLLNSSSLGLYSQFLLNFLSNFTVVLFTIKRRYRWYRQRTQGNTFVTQNSSLKTIISCYNSIYMTATEKTIAQLNQVKSWIIKWLCGKSGIPSDKTKVALLYPSGATLQEVRGSSRILQKLYSPGDQYPSICKYRAHRKRMWARS